MMVWFLKLCFILVSVRTGVHGEGASPEECMQWSCKGQCNKIFFASAYLVWPQKQSTDNPLPESKTDNYPLDARTLHEKKSDADGALNATVSLSPERYDWSNTVRGDYSEFRSSSSPPLTLQSIQEPRKTTACMSSVTNILSSMPPSLWSLPSLRPPTSVSSLFLPSVLSNKITRPLGIKRRLIKTGTWSWAKANFNTRGFARNVSGSVYFYRSCFCDHLCPFFDDCCFDYHQECANNIPAEGAAINENSNAFASEDKTTSTDVKLLKYLDCLPFPTDGALHILMVSKCGRSAAQPRTQQKLLCENNTSNQRLLTLPVVLKASLNIMFRNVFCAFCHGYQLKDLETRAFFYKCDRNVSGYSQAEIEKAIEANNCTLKSNESKLSPVIRPCTPTHDLYKLSYDGLFQQMLHKGKSTSDFNDSQFQPLSLFNNGEDYEQEQLQHLKVTCEDPCLGAKNIIDLLQKFPSEGKGPACRLLGGSGIQSSLPNFQIFFELSENSWSYDIERTKVIAEVTRCPVDQVYVTYYGSCQPLVCSAEMYPFEGKCLLQESRLANKSLLLFPNGNTRLFLRVVIETSSLQGHRVLAAVENITSEFQRGLEDKVQQDLETRMNVTQSVTIELYPTFNCYAPNMTAWAKTLKVDYINVSIGSVIDAARVALNDANDTLSEDDVNIAEVLIFNANMTELNESSCGTGVLSFESQGVNLETDNSGEYFIHRLSTFYPLEGVAFSLKLSPPVNATVTLVQSALCVQKAPEVPRCSSSSGVISLTKESYFMENQTLVVPLDDHDDVYAHEEFRVYANGTAFVCSNFSSSHVEYLLLFKFYSGVNEIATVVCLLVSIGSLMVVLITYLLLTQLRNVPGKIVMSLSVSMMTMQGLMLLVRLPVRWLCLAVSWLLHWSMLSTFLWNSALLFDVAFVLRRKSVSSSAKGFRGRAFRCYVIICWLMPMFLVLSLAVMDHYGVYEVGYGAKGQCCLGIRNGVLWFVIFPISVSLLFNILCFACALFALLQSAKLLREATSYSQKGTNSRDKRRVVVYIRISLITGLTWGLCFAAAFLDVEGLWIAHIILNASQGLYFLFCFVFKPRVWFMLRARFSSCCQLSKQGSVATPQKCASLSHIVLDT